MTIRLIESRLLFLLPSFPSKRFSNCQSISIWYLNELVLQSYFTVFWVLTFLKIGVPQALYKFSSAIKVLIAIVCTSYYPNNGRNV